MSGQDLPDDSSAFELGRRSLVEKAASQRADLSLRYWRQHAHLTVPASDMRRAAAALDRGTEPVGRLLERFAISSSELADALQTDAPTVEGLLASPRMAPVVVLDGEDAQVGRADVALLGLETTADLLAARAGARRSDAPLRFF